MSLIDISPIIIKFKCYGSTFSTIMKIFKRNMKNRRSKTIINSNCNEIKLLFSGTDGPSEKTEGRRIRTEH